ncbi:hypothetical protein [Sulfolobus acidocaldarius]|uniref:Calcineurin-like phosphoesterase domain-containing protein n=4 Tax=Sulfolobus acidocaldarius TaxID=2285 RepID=Q4JBF9_SULAC|nr:hypothetical protein [Sulfolobus acidocaldarius]AAY79870.1 hypothetical protein Saci_0460 [Sulfolobus acidocaldarius DSM 639]
MAIMALITRLPCENSLIEKINSLNVDYVVGLGDVECPQFLRDFYGILGEMDNITTMKYLKNTGKLIESSFLTFSTNFSNITITHFPPRLEYGSLIVRNQILTNSPKIVFHGHSEVQKIYNLGLTKIVSIGSGEKGYYVIYDSNMNEIILKRSSH